MTPWVKRLLLANVAMFVITSPGIAPWLVHYLALVPAWVFVRPWTLVTYMFLHAGLMHLLFNMIGLFFFGPRLEARLGERDFFFLYLLSGLGGAVLSFIFEPGAAVVGASGAVFGVLLGFARYWPDEPIYIWGILPIQARILVIVLAALSIYSGFAGAGGRVAHFAHLGGFAAGWLYLRWRDRRRKRWDVGPKKASPIRRAVDEIRPEARRWDAIRLDDLHEVNREEVVRIRDKVKELGVDSLTAGEREFMDRMAARS
jgi:membrane associated rhomboid family serine protease